VDSATFTRQAQKAFDDELASAALGPGSSFVHELTSELAHPEYRYLRQERFCSLAGISSAVAAELSMVALRNPANSGALIVCHEFDIHNRTVSAQQFTIRHGLDTVTWDASIRGVLNDLRYGPPATALSTGQVAVDSEAGAHGTATARSAVLAGDTKTVKGPWVLPPGTFLVLANAVVNVECVATFRWVERYVEGSEMQGAGV
jgi:hypothetical protein